MRRIQGRKKKKSHTVFTIKTNFSKVRAIYQLEALRHDIKDRLTAQQGAAGIHVLKW